MPKVGRADSRSFFVFFLGFAVHFVLLFTSQDYGHVGFTTVLTTLFKAYSFFLTFATVLCPTLAPEAPELQSLAL